MLLGQEEMYPSLYEMLIFPLSLLILYLFYGILLFLPHSKLFEFFFTIYILLIFLLITSIFFFTS